MQGANRVISAEHTVLKVRPDGPFRHAPFSSLRAQSFRLELKGEHRGRFCPWRNWRVGWQASGAGHGIRESGAVREVPLRCARKLAVPHGHFLPIGFWKGIPDIMLLS